MWVTHSGKYFTAANITRIWMLELNSLTGTFTSLFMQFSMRLNQHKWKIHIKGIKMLPPHPRKLTRYHSKAEAFSSKWKEKLASLLLSLYLSLWITESGNAICCMLGEEKNDPFLFQSLGNTRLSFWSAFSFPRLLFCKNCIMVCLRVYVPGCAQTRICMRGDGE